MPAAIDTDAILSALGELVYTWEIEQDRLYWGGHAASVLRIAGDVDVTTGKAFQRLIDTGNGPTRYDAILGARLRSFSEHRPDEHEGTPFRLTYALQTSNGRYLEIEESGRCISNVAGLPILAFGVMRILDLAKDPLRKFTKAGAEQPRMLSRAALVQHLDAALKSPSVYTAEIKPAPHSRGKRRGKTKTRSTAFMLAGLSDLGHLNRTYGFDVADEIIGVVAARLRGALRAGDEIGRYSGNKLGIILKNCTDEELDTAARRFQSAIRSDAIETPNGAVLASIKLGAVMAPDIGSIAEMLQGAEEALAFAKKHPGGDFVRFRADIRQFEQRRSNQRVSDEIIAALNDRRIALAFQPIACSKSRRIRYHEGLVRLVALDGRIVGAGELISQAERTGLLKHIDMRVIELAVDQLTRDPEAMLSINVDGLSMIESDWLDMLAGSLVGRRVEAGRLTIEITETALIRDFAATSTVVHRIHDLGIRVALDDFGAGHTSFRTLRNLPIDIIKIDGAFMHNIRTNKDDRFFVSTLVSLARHLEMKTVAEWVRDEETGRLLTEMGVDYLQGDLIGETRILPQGALLDHGANVRPCGDKRENGLLR